MAKVCSILFAAMVVLQARSVLGDCNPQIITTDVVIIGAGVAGLSAAKTLLDDDDPLNFVILEAQNNRVGGRVRSNSEWFPGYTVEEGANWFSDNTQNTALELSLGYGVEVFNQDFDNYNLYGYDDNGVVCILLRGCGNSFEVLAM